MGAFLELTTLKALMRIPTADTTRDVELQIYVDAANAHLYQLFGGLTAATVTSYTDRLTVDDWNTNALWTRRWPVLSSPAAAVVSAGATVDTSLYRLDDLGLLRLLEGGNFWPFGIDQVVVTYSAGFATTDPALAELKMAAAHIAIYQANTFSHAGLRRESIGEYEYEQNDGASGGGDGSGGFGIPTVAERILANWTTVLRGSPTGV